MAATESRRLDGSFARARRHLKLLEAVPGQQGEGAVREPPEILPILLRIAALLERSPEDELDLGVLTAGRRALPGREIVGLAAQRAVDVGLLLVARGGQDRVPDLAEQELDLQAGCLDLLEQGGRVGAVGSSAVLGHLAVLGRIGHERVGGRLDPCEAASDAAPAPGRNGHLRDEGIVAAGIEQHQPEPPQAFDRMEHEIERDGLELHVVVGGEPRVGRDQEVAAGQLQPVPGKEDQRQLRRARLTSECLQRLQEGRATDVPAQLDPGEPDPAQGCRHGLRVVVGIGEGGGVLVGRVADHESDPRTLVRIRPPAPRQRQGEQHDQPEGGPALPMHPLSAAACRPGSTQPGG